jgi:tetratricopeptide (TPR) repeat protein
MRRLRSPLQDRAVVCAPSGRFLRSAQFSGLQKRWAHRVKVALLKTWFRSVAAGVSFAEREATDTLATTEGTRWLRFSTKPAKVYVRIGAVVCSFWISSALAQPDAQFTEANQEYAQGQYKEAIVGYETLVRAGEWNANLFYDLGNAYFRTGDFGHAILNYARALALDRHHPEAKANLQIARDEARALELQPSRLERYLQFATANQYSVAAAAAFWLMIFAVATVLFARRRSAALMALSMCCLFVCGFAVWAIYTLEHGNNGRALAIVTGNDVQARLATADTANSVLALPPGSEIKILSTRGDWMYAALPNDLRGWIPAKDAEPVRL